MTKLEFIQKATAAAQAVREAGGRISVPVAVAQAALESNWGRSQLARKANNIKGVKAGSSWGGPVIELPTQEWREVDGTWYTTVARWRRYADWPHAFRDYAELIERVYPHAAMQADYPFQFLKQLVAKDYPKYATDPGYERKVAAIIAEYDLVRYADEAVSVPDENEGLLIVFDADNNEVLRLPIPTGGSIVDRQRGDRRYIRVERPE